jgi:nucleoside-diphosphate-sugar epimerase
LIDLYLLAATHPAAPGETFNAVDDGPVTLREFSEAYLRMIPTNRALRIPGWLLAPAAEVIDPFTPGTNYRYVVNQMRGRGQVLNTKSREVLGWIPQVGLQEGMQHSEEWLRTEGIL